MPTPVYTGSQLLDVNLLELLPPDEGEIDIYYGQIGGGKTYGATVDVLEELKKGKIVYASWDIKFDGYDERMSKWNLFKGILGIKKNFYYFPKENLHTIDIFDLENLKVDGQSTGIDFVEWISKISDCMVFLDEGHVAFDSYEKTKMEMAKRNIALLTRHLDRKIIVISQRPMQVHLTFRSQVNRFYKFEKISHSKLFKTVRFRRTEFQETSSDGLPNEAKLKVYNEETHMMDETDEYEFALSTKTYTGKKRIYQAYNSKYRRMGQETSQKNYAQLFHMVWIDRFKAFWNTTTNEKRNIPKPH